MDSDATAGIGPGVPYAERVDNLINTNYLGGTRMIRYFGLLLRPSGRLVVTARTFGTVVSLSAHQHSTASTLR